MGKLGMFDVDSDGVWWKNSTNETLWWRVSYRIAQRDPRVRPRGCRDGGTAEPLKGFN